LIAERLIELSRERYEALFGRTRPLDSLAAKIEVGYALGLLSNPARIQLNMIRDVSPDYA